MTSKNLLLLYVIVSVLKRGKDLYHYTTLHIFYVNHYKCMYLLMESKQLTTRFTERLASTLWKILVVLVSGKMQWK